MGCIDLSTPEAQKMLREMAKAHIEIMARRHEEFMQPFNKILEAEKTILGADDKPHRGR